MENKTSKYFKYAIGEIVLVVIGILLALQINTWNENRKSRNEETKILTALQADFKVSKTRIEETMVLQKRMLHFSKRLMQIHLEEEKYKNTDSLVIMIRAGALSYWRSEPVTGAYDAMISAGKIDLIQNEDLRHLLAQYAADLESGFEDHISCMDLLTLLFRETSKLGSSMQSAFVSKLLNLKKIDNQFEAIDRLLKEDTFYGLLLNKTILEKNRYNRQQSMLDQVNSILEIITEELKE